MHWYIHRYIFVTTKSSTDTNITIIVNEVPEYITIEVISFNTNIEILYKNVFNVRLVNIF